MGTRKLSVQKEIAFIILILGSLGVVVFAIFGQHGVLRMQAKADEYASFKAQKTRLEEANAALRTRIDKLGHDPETLILEIRNKLRYARPGEIVMQESGSPGTSPAVHDVAPPTGNAGSPAARKNGPSQR